MNLGRRSGRLAVSLLAFYFAFAGWKPTIWSQVQLTFHHFTLFLKLFWIVLKRPKSDEKWPKMKQDMVR